MPNSRNQESQASSPLPESFPVRVTFYSPPGYISPRKIPSALPDLPAHPDSQAELPPLPPPLVFHLSAPNGLPPSIAHKKLTLIDFLVIHSPLSRSFLTALADIGAIWTHFGFPHPRVSPRAVRLSSAIEAAEPLPLESPLYVRIHAVPRRHKALERLVVLRRIGDVIAVEKPAGVPVAPTNDNVRECALALAEEETGIVNLRITSRLDVGTSGVLLLAATKDAAAAVNTAIKSDRCKKIYAVLTARKPPPCGVLKHWVRKVHRGQGVLDSALVREWGDGVEPQDDPGGWVVAELIVERVEEISLRGETAWESLVVLVTGRTHQIRMQFAAEESPVFGDSMYEGAGRSGRIEAGSTLGDYAQRHGLHALRVELPLSRGSCLAQVAPISAGRPWWRRL